MLELFKGQVSAEYLFHTLTYKEAVLLRESRLERLKKEKEHMERERKEAERQQKTLRNKK